MEQFLYLLRAFVQNPSLDHAKKVSDTLSEDVIRQICCTSRQDFVQTSLLTIISELDVRNRNEIVTHVIDALTKIIEISRINKLISLQTTAVILLKQLNVNTNAPHQTISEELKINCIKCIETAFRRATSDVVEAFYTKDNLHIIAQTLSVCDSMIAKETFRPLRIAAIRCIMSVEQVHDEADESDIVVRRQIGDIVFVVLPKIVNTLTNIATSEETLGETLIAISIKALGRILHLVFEDSSEDDSVRSINEQTRISIESALKMSSNDTVNTDVLKFSKKSLTVEKNLQQMKDKKRSSEWLVAASLKLQPIFKRLHKLIGRKSEVICRELFKFTDVLIRHCQKHLSSCVPVLLEINISLANKHGERSKFVYNDCIIDIAEELFIAQLIHLPRIIYTGDEDEQISNMLQLRGLVVMLCETQRLKITLANESSLGNFVAILLSIVELERSAKLLEENISIFDINDKTPETINSLVMLRNNTQWKMYKNIRNTEIMIEIELICTYISQTEPVNVLVLEYLANLIAKNSINCNEALIIVQMFVKNAFAVNDPCESLHYVILDELFCDYRWDLATETSEHRIVSGSDNRSEWFEDRTEGLFESAISVRFSDITDPLVDQQYGAITINDVKNNILHECLVIETVGMYAQQLANRYQPFLIKSLHRLLEKSTSIHNMIRISALIALNSLKAAFALNSISELILNNADYITYAINMSLKRPDQIETAIRILSIVLYYCSVDSIPHLENIISTVLAETKKINQTINTLSFMRVFELILSTIRENIRKNSLPNEEFEPNDKKPAEEAELVKGCLDVWLGILNEKEEEDFEENLNDNTNENDGVNETNFAEDMEINEMEKKALPILVQLSINIIKRCIPYLGSKEQDTKLIALKCVNTGLDIVKDYENELLPIVHQVWHPFVHQCMEDKSSVVLRYCMQLLAKLAQYAKDFIYKRSTDQLIPYIIKHLQELSKVSAVDKKGFLYEHTQEFKLLQELLIVLPGIVICLDVQEREFDKIQDAIVWLLHKDQPQALQTNCVNLFRQLALFDICSVYVKLLKYHENDHYKCNCKKIFPNQF